MEIAEMMYRLVFNRNIDRLGTEKCRERITKGTFSSWDLLLRMMKSEEYRKPYRRPTPSKRLHSARMAWVGQLPAAHRILDIGGSSPSLPEGALIELGYAHRPEKLIIFDKPPAEQYWGTPGYSQDNVRNFAWGQVQYIHGYAEDILQSAALNAQKFDMIFMGQVVEHIYEDKLPAVLSWICEHLTEHGTFFLDTPNRLVTRYETGEDCYIDPDHKREYTPDAFAALLAAAGFTSLQHWGILDMPHVIENQCFGVSDFYDGALVTPNPATAYCFAMSGRK
jgi:SAM-dependent methyltransferase